MVLQETLYPHLYEIISRSQRGVNTYFRVGVKVVISDLFTEIAVDLTRVEFGLLHFAVFTAYSL